MPLKLLCSTVLLLFLFNSVINAQLVNGRVTNDKGESVAYAHVFFKSVQHMGTITNEGGYFKLDTTYFSHDTVVISILGYEEWEEPVLSFTEEEMQIELEPASVRFDEVTIFSVTYLRYLLIQAIKRIPQNYPTERHRLEGYFQEYSISDSSYAEVLEAHVTLETGGYDQKLVKSKAYLNELRRSDDFRNLPPRLNKMQTNQVLRTYGINSLLTRTFSIFAWNQELTLDYFEKSMEQADLQLWDQRIFDGDTIITIRFNDSTIRFSDGEAVLFSLITIRKNDFAILNIVYGNVFSEEKDYSEVQFRKIGNKYYPSFIKSIISYKYDDRTRSNYNSKTLIVHKVKSNPAAFEKKKKKQLMKTEIELREIKYDYNEEFWETFAVGDQLPATAILHAALNRKGDLKEQFKHNEKRISKSNSENR